MKYLNKYIKIVVVAALIVSTVSCNDEFLNTKPETAISYDEAFESITNAESALVGMYNNNSAYFFEGLYVPIIADLVGEDVLLDSKRNWGWFLSVYQLESLANYRWVEDPWTNGYFLLYQANQIIENADKVPDATDAQKGNLKGQAKVMRAHTMLKLVQMYGEAYSVNPSAPGILNANMVKEWDEEDIARSTVGDIYGQILQDLEEAIPMLKDYATEVEGLPLSERPRMYQDSTAFFNVRSANAVLARTYLDMHNWEKARDHAAIAKKDIQLMGVEGLVSGFNYPNSETLYSIKYTADDNGIYGSIPSFYFPVSGYSSMRADTSFVDTYNDFDVRKNWFPHGRDLMIRWDGDEEDSPLDADNYVVLKFQSINGQTGYAERISMRASEMYLIEAECEAELGNYSEAQNLLHAIQKRAFPGAIKSVKTGQELIDEILLERRKELVGEGFRWNDIKRRSLPFKRNGHHWAKWDFQFGDEDYYRLTFPIPQSEIDNNSALTEADQNPGY
ncbi:RagB/SusD family nutrient uptake outer membrane protein [Carboxylicivirga sp. M1479]|uniref:RagB/SusD family nutrient uptake outer membrane protein n=1 Tax=Carboxylicivirga sp. M1479 TaxID=2594476 RepID=UPI00117765C6|nr:RagB/SusD family nutrient uptake outer membrane protein [Carboxylicivirga sp. M1479]TRX70639.1 RagB/SusD family nutrient uptake outer membrane protein [Carboxylicivirga sp. M1479]